MQLFSSYGVGEILQGARFWLKKKKQLMSKKFWYMKKGNGTGYIKWQDEKWNSPDCLYRLFGICTDWHLSTFSNDNFSFFLLFFFICREPSVQIWVRFFCNWFSLLLIGCLPRYNMHSISIGCLCTVSTLLSSLKHINWLGSKWSVLLLASLAKLFLDTNQRFLSRILAEVNFLCFSF